MAELNPPQWLQAGSHPANTDRLLTQAFAPTEGVIDLAGGDLLVAERAAGANMSVDVAAGSAFIAGTESGTQGTYHVYNDAVANLTIAAADATNPRIDLVVAQVRDSFYSGGDDDWQLAVLTGTPAASPAEPAVPENAIVLARVDVGAAAASITDADITDRRAQAATRRALIPTLTDTGRVFQPTGGAGVNHNPSALTTFEQAFPDEVSFEDLGVPVEVTATGTITQAANSDTGQVRGKARVEISLDGGITWSEGTETEGDTMRNNGVNLVSHSPAHRFAGTPTASVRVRMTVSQESGSLGDQFWRFGVIVATVHYLAS